MFSNIKDKKNAYFFLGLAFSSFLGLVAHPQPLHMNSHLRYRLKFYSM